MIAQNIKKITFYLNQKFAFFAIILLVAAAAIAIAPKNAFAANNGNLYTFVPPGSVDTWGDIGDEPLVNSGSCGSATVCNSGVPASLEFGISASQLSASIAHETWIMINLGYGGGDCNTGHMDPNSLVVGLNNVPLYANGTTDSCSAWNISSHVSFEHHASSGTYSYFNGSLGTTDGVSSFPYFYVKISSDPVGAPDTSTRIIDFTPEDNATTTNPVTFSLHGYVNPDDIGTFIGVKFTLHNIDQNVLLLSAFSPSDIYFLDGFNATTSGDFYFSTTTTVGEGNYRINAILERSYLGGWIVNPFSPINQDLSHQFIVCGSSDVTCQGTFIGNLSQNGYSELNSIFASTTATSTAAAATNCNPLGSFDIIKCGAFLFIPGGDYLDTTMKGLKDGVLTRVPWGYLTRMITIFNTNATTSLPTFTASFITGTNGNTSTSTLSFDPGDMLAGANTLLTNTRDPFTGKNARDVFEPLVQLAVALAVLFTIVADLTGSHRHHDDSGRGNTKLS